MAMHLGSHGGRGVAPVMNVTPLVDVVLVLLIIFMVVTPLLSKQFWVHTPKQEKEEVTPEQAAEDPEPPLVLHVGPGETVTVNGTTIPPEDLPWRLKRMFAARDDHILFFDADDDVPYGFSVEMMDRAREGGAVTIAALTSALEAAPTPPAAPTPDD